MKKIHRERYEKRLEEINRALEILPNEAKLDHANRILNHAIDHFKPRKVFALFSGGHDSLCSTHLTSKLKQFDGVIHINTQIGIEETRDFVRQTCKDHNWPLKEYFPPLPPWAEDVGGKTAYECLIRRFGFPGPAGHGMMYQRLKERCIERLIKENKEKWRDKIMLVTGVRRQESARRMGNLEITHTLGSQLWVCPLIDWSSDDKWNYIDTNQLKRNKIAESLCMSGECLCGAFAKPHEIVEIKNVSPKTAEYIEYLESVASQTNPIWGTRPKKVRKDKKHGNEMCWSCENKYQ